VRIGGAVVRVRGPGRDRVVYRHLNQLAALLRRPPLRGGEGVSLELVPGPAWRHRPIHRRLNRGIDHHLHEVRGQLAPAPVRAVASSGGAPLAGDLRHEFEGRLGLDLSSVRLHHGSDASSAARSIGARAFTVGSHVVFGAGEFDPLSASGRAVLSHELVHVAQQAGASATGPLRIGPQDDSFEREADQVSLDATTPITAPMEFGLPKISKRKMKYKVAETYTNNSQPVINDEKKTAVLSLTMSRAPVAP